MPWFLDGLPLHPLAVHATVALVSLAVLGALVVALWPAARRRYGSLVVLTAVAATVCTVIAEQSGEALEHTLPHSEAIEVHAAAADYLKLWMVPLMIAVAAFVLVHRRADRMVVKEASGGAGAVAVKGRQRVLALVLAAVTVVLALGTAFVVYRAGDLGAQAVWGGRVYQQQPFHRPAGG
jgi:uncharacterized membrane protein